MVEGEGFEPSKAEPSDLQSDPFGRSGTPPNEGNFHLSIDKSQAIYRFTTNKFEISKNGAGTRSRTRDRLITNQLLYHLSYASLV